MYKFWFIAIFALLTGETLACNCAGYDIEESYNKYPSVFVGTVEKVEVIKRREPGSCGCNRVISVCSVWWSRQQSRVSSSGR